MLKYSCQTKDIENSLFDTKINEEKHKLKQKDEHKEQHTLEHKEDNNCQIEFILDENSEEIEFVIEDDDEDEDIGDDIECFILRKC